MAQNLKRYAAEAGITHINLHQTRHTFARIVSEETGSLVETQDASAVRAPRQLESTCSELRPNEINSKRISACLRG
jgi:hypothetical protein